MRRDEMIKSIKLVDEAITNAGLHDIARSGRAPTVERIQSTLESFQKFSIYYNSFSAIEKKVCSIFSIDAAAEPTFWTIVLSDRPENRSTPESLRRVFRGISFFQEYASSIIDLLHRDTGSGEARISTNDEGEVTQVGSTLRCYISDPEEPSITPDDFAKLLVSVNELYSSIDEIVGGPNARVTIGALDSGSDKSIDFLGSAKIFEILSRFLTQCWNRVRFGDAMKFSAQIRATSEGIDLLEKIKKAKDENKLSEKDADRITQNVLACADKLLSGGLYPEEAVNKRFLDIHQLPMKRQKLIEDKSPAKSGTSRTKKTSSTKKKPPPKKGKPTRK